MEEMSRLYVMCTSKRVRAGERQLFKSYLSAFGMSPADRSRVRASPQSPEADDPLSKLLRAAKVQ